MQEVDPKRVHLLERDDLHILYFKDTMEFCEIPVETAEEARPMIAENLQFVVNYDPENLRQSALTGFLNILQFNISEDCNLRCRYCVAKGGNYGRESSLMSPETAIKGLDLFYSYYREIGNIQLFGGEPLLNIDTIEAICENLAERKIRNPEFKLPRLNLNTNGTILNDRVIELIKKYDLQVVVSIDGPEEVHDDFRKTCNGTGSFATIIRNVHSMFEETGQPVGYEMVYSNHLLEKGWTLLKVLEYMQEILPKSNYTMFVAPMVNTGENPALQDYYGFSDELLENQLEVIRTGFDRIREGLEPVFHYDITSNIRSLMQRRGRAHFCGVGVSKLMVDGRGDVVPCNALINRKGFVIGTVEDPDTMTKKLPPFQEKFLGLTKTVHFKECADCWAYNLCHFCMSHMIKGDEPAMDEINPELCKTHRRFTEELVLQIAALSKNPVHWEHFLKFLQVDPKLAAQATE